MSKNLLELKYQGQAVDDGSIDLQDLIPALIGMDEILQRINKLINGESSRLIVKAQPLEKGSVVITLELVTNFIQTLFSGVDTVQASAKILEVLLGTAGVAGLIKAIKMKASEDLSTIEYFENDDGKTVTMKTAKGQIAICKEGLILLGDKDMVKAIKKVIVDPIQKNNLDQLIISKIQDSNKISESITSQEVSYFDFEPLSKESQLDDQTGEDYLQVISPNLDPDKQLKWEFRRTGSKIFANMNDADFWAKLKNGDQKISVNDIYKCKITTKYCVKGGEVKGDVSIDKVLEVINNDTSQKLF